MRQKTTTFLIILCLSGYVHAEWPVPPAGWEDFYFDLIDDRNHLEQNWNYPLLFDILKQVKKKGIQNRIVK